MSLQNRSTLRPTVPTKKGSRTLTYQPPSSHNSSMMPCFRQHWSLPFRGPCLAWFPTLFCRSLTTTRLKYVSRSTFALPGFPSLAQQLLWAFIFLWKKASQIKSNSALVRSGGGLLRLAAEKLAAKPLSALTTTCSLLHNTIPVISRTVALAAAPAGQATTPSSTVLFSTQFESSNRSVNRAIAARNKVECR